VWRVGLDSCGSAQREMASCLEQGDELEGSAHHAVRCGFTCCYGRTYSDRCFSVALFLRLRGCMLWLLQLSACVCFISPQFSGICFRMALFSARTSSQVLRTLSGPQPMWGDNHLYFVGYSLCVCPLERSRGNWFV
jgi:hypothetical protein